MEQIKAFFWRLLIHGIGLFTSAIVLSLMMSQEWAPWGSHHAQVVEVLIFFANYGGMVALFAPRHERCSTFIQSFVIILLVILCWIADLLAVFIPLAGFAMLLIKAISKRKMAKGRFLLLVILSIYIISLLAYDLKPFPMWFCITYIIAVLLLGGSERIEAGEEKQKAKTVTEKPWEEPGKNRVEAETVQVPDNQEATSDAFGEYYQGLAAIMAYQSVVPRDIWPHLNNIEEKTRAIIACMKEDERDVQQGAAFLNRYLPMIKNALESLALLKQHQVSGSQFQEARLMTIQSLQEMELAFSEMHQDLLSNNVDDLMADLKSMSQLVRAHGFGEKK
ncbi:5-bromo-4-chloroindolyl phosphate hydrolysis family protein [Xenorhabdus szentirmaii]|uniref:5-bromo-4-chloroindolyl phosphate hydrolysis family protein n=1 Tax=Xenorhabdus szentirmaii TaxID=290112 RepID=UPI00198D57E8|nr:5-bromo-4-chloroindolyl phosphate hydrolysis family protein [Xenorhabdus sp. 38]MBD2780963.1 5-bromo-4-chloroindolyl phosphate hydrolysis family protein [Xenorhabdus sp. 38]